MSNKTMLNMPDFVLIIIFVFLFLLIVIDVFTPLLRFLFTQTNLGQSLFSLISAVSILYFGILWGASKIKDDLRAVRGYKERMLTIVYKASKFIGLEKISTKDLRYIFLSILVGAAYNIFAIYLRAILKGGNIYLIIPPLSEPLIINSLTFAPLLEEPIFRGIYLSSFIKILGKNYRTAALGIMLSSVTFGWIHSGSLLDLILKTVGGFLLGIIYLFKWKKNFIAALLTHIGVNVVGICLYIP
ncbi:MAG: CPBP family intramembrane glutamic endopeptidase [Candidatus Bathyarchaeia archaeon]